MNALHVCAVLYGVLIISLSLFMNTEKTYVFDIATEGILLEQLSMGVANQNQALPIQRAVTVVYIPVKKSTENHYNQSVKRNTIENILKNGI